MFLNSFLGSEECLHYFLDDCPIMVAVSVRRSVECFAHVHASSRMPSTSRDRAGFVTGGRAERTMARILCDSSELVGTPHWTQHGKTGAKPHRGHFCARFIALPIALPIAAPPPPPRARGSPCDWGLTLFHDSLLRYVQNCRRVVNVSLSAVFHRVLRCS